MTERHLTILYNLDRPLPYEARLFDSQMRLLAVEQHLTRRGAKRWARTWGLDRQVFEGRYEVTR